MVPDPLPLHWCAAATQRDCHVQFMPLQHTHGGWGDSAGSFALDMLVPPRSQPRAQLVAPDLF